MTALYLGWPAFRNRHFVIWGGGGSVTGQFADLETCAKVPGAPGTTQLKVGQPGSHNGRQGATCCPRGAAHQQR